MRELAVPIFFESSLIRVLGLINVFLISRYNQEAVAAIGVSNQLVNFINMIFLFVTLGSAVIISQYLGAENPDGAEEAVIVAVVVNLVLGIILGTVISLFHRPLLIFLGLSGGVLDFTASYVSVVGGFCLFNGINRSLATIMRNYGQARTPMLVFIGLMIVNLLGNGIIIIRPWGLPDYGIRGIALWTVLSQGGGTFFLTSAMIKLRIPLSLNSFRFSMVAKVLRVGVPGSGDAFLYTLAQIILISYVTALGSKAITAYTYAVNMIALVQILGFSVGQGSQILVGRAVGAGRPGEAYRTAFCHTRLAIVLNMSVMVVLYVFQRPILHLFTADEEIISLLFRCFSINLLLEIGRPYNLVIGPSIRAAGDVNWAILASATSILLVLIPLGYLLTVTIPLGLSGIFLALCADEWLRGQLMNWRWRSGRWRSFALTAKAAPIPRGTDGKSGAEPPMSNP